MKKYERSKFGKLLDERKMSLTEFGELLYNKTGYFVAPTNISNYATGYKQIKTIHVAGKFAEALGVEINKII